MGQQGGLVLERRIGQSIVIGQDVEIQVTQIRSGTVKLRIVAPREVAVNRREIAERLDSKAATE